MTETITFERQGHIAIIRIDRPHRRNAFDRATAEALEAAIDAYEDDDDLRVAILTGSDIVFSAGQDLFAVNEGGMAATEKRGGFGIMRVPPTKPIIAAVEGHALAGGMELALACDLIVSSRTATWGIPEAGKSLAAVGGGLIRLPKRVPYHLAMELALTAKPWPATRMAELGLVNRLCEPGEAVATALALAEEVLECAPLAVKASKAVVQRAYDWTDAEAWDEQMTYAMPVFGSEDLGEGLAAFAEKRKPVWSGR